MCACFRRACAQIAGGIVCVWGKEHLSPCQRHHSCRAVDGHRGQYKVWVCMCQGETARAPYNYRAWPHCDRNNMMWKWSATSGRQCDLFLDDRAANQNVFIVQVHWPSNDQICFLFNILIFGGPDCRLDSFHTNHKKSDFGHYLVHSIYPNRQKDDMSLHSIMQNKNQNTSETSTALSHASDVICSQSTEYWFGACGSYEFDCPYTHLTQLSIMMFW